MLNKIFKSLLIGAFAIFALTLNSCKKPEDTKASITVIDVNGDVVVGATVRLHQDGLISPSGQYSEASDEQKTDNSGKTEHVFEHEAILNIDVNKWVFDIVENYHGSISAEHGVGMVKKDYLSYTRSAEEIVIMKGIKQVFDPNGLMNPGKIFDL